MDLNLPWTVTHDSYDEVVAIHVVEHLQSLIHFMDEAWNVLKPEGQLYIETPLAGGNAELEFADPTHIRCFTPYSFFNYFTPHGIEQFGYTNKAWKILKCHTEPIFPDKSLHCDVVVFRGTPIK